jgi:hypothetical protein
MHFVVNMAAKDVEKAEQQGLTEFFKPTSNMICFDFEDQEVQLAGDHRRILPKAPGILPETQGHVPLVLFDRHRNGVSVR